MNWIQKFIAGEQMLNQKVGITGAQLYSRAFQPDLLPVLQKMELERRARDAPLEATRAAKWGAALPIAGVAAIPGMNTALGSTLLGAGVGGLATPTAPGESALLNTAIGAASGYAGYKVGNTIANWAQARAKEPLMGYTKQAGNRVAAEAIGSDASAPTQEAIGEFQDRTKALLSEVHSPQNSAPIGQPTWDVMDTASARLRDTTKSAFEQTPAIRDLRNIATSTQSMDAQKLGNISQELGQEYAQNMFTASGDKTLGKALQVVKEHVDDVLGGTIQDPNLASAYDAWRGQYRNYLLITHSPGILNSATGEVNMTAFGKYLQGEDRYGYTGGHTTSPLYDFARWGQSTGEGKGAPPINPLKLGLPTLGYAITHNPISRAAGGVTSRALAPFATGLAPAGTALGTTEGLLLPPGLPGLQRRIVGEVPYLTE
jgi:HPt (histidine-containing phosphotransfer) domain-containing protein